MSFTLQDTKILIKKLENYPENVQDILYACYLQEVGAGTVRLAQKILKDFKEYPIISCVAGIDSSKFWVETSENEYSSNSEFIKVVNSICYNYLKQFHPDLFKEN